MERSRLQTVAPDLDATLRATPADRRRAVGWSAARWAIERVGLAHPAIEEALSTGQTSILSVVVADLDRRYFELQELSESGQRLREEVRAAFALARAASATEFAARGEYIEAVYEAGIAVDDWPGLRAVVGSCLGDDA